MGTTCECTQDCLTAEASKELDLTEDLKPLKRQFSRNTLQDETRRDTESSQEFSTDCESMSSPKFL